MRVNVYIHYWGLEASLLLMTYSIMPIKSDYNNGSVINFYKEGKHLVTSSRALVFEGLFLSRGFWCEHSWKPLN